MAAIVGIDAAILTAPEDTLTLPAWDAATGTWTLNGFTLLPERNELSISISVDVAEHRPFVESLEDAWVGKARTWMDWSGSFSGFYDDEDDSIFNDMKAGLKLQTVIFDSRLTAVATSQTDYWFGKILLTSVDHTTGSEDFSTLDVDFEGAGPLLRSATS